ncbi:hypothetical protein Ccrd_014410 [Cynara cardunculus var. scolymus]|uniref:MRN complex-interacting protein N-terminal domain-containing protein n=1 Tax=Cynara cardunculus var. scolymus TaxID=59895 RepID=A0A118K4A9_CYNCS|nr:hypothetical protein Ccrd_014410 [Cynara cardunculus var. scolymus]
MQLLSVFQHKSSYIGPRVKQRKKSSNKWSCVICNEKQSVRKVFSQGFMAKDVRKFVQSFNMSRQFVEQQQELPEEALVQEQIETQPNRKRTDWSEYIDSDINDVGVSDDEGDLCEPNVVTELPKPLFKKPKLSYNYSEAGLDSEDGERLRKPVFGKRITKRKINNPDKEPRITKRVGEYKLNHEYVDKEMGGSSKWRENSKIQRDDNVNDGSAYERSSSMMTKVRRPISERNACQNDGDNVDHGFTYTGSSSVMTKLKKPVSKWNEFIDDGDELQLESRCQEINHGAFETKVSDEIVEDDVHPDFL